ncbi:MAG TPA: universal stress protein [Candidatus Xenobia bacterium]
MGTDEETRLQQEALVSRSYLAQVRRILLPTRGGPDSEVAARLLGTLGLQQVRVTSLGVGAPPQPPPGLEVVTKTLENVSPLEGIVREAESGYDLLVLGCGHDRPGGKTLFGPVVDAVVSKSPCRVLVVRAPRHGQPLPETWPERILLPVTGTKSSIRAGELAVALARSQGATLRALHVVEPSYWFTLEAKEVGRDILDAVAVLGQPYGVDMEAEVEEGVDPGHGIVAAAARSQCDLIVMSAVRRSGRRLFLGSTLVHVLSHATCPIAVVVI